MSTISTQDIQKLREATGAGIMEVKKALQGSNGDMDKAIDLLRKAGKKLAQKVGERKTSEGRIGSYIHTDARSGALVAIACETDFVARTEDFDTLGHDIAMHIVALRPRYVDESQIPADIVAKETAVFMEQVKADGKPEKLHDTIVKGKLQAWYREICLLRQPFVKDDTKSVDDVLKEYVARLGENIRIVSFSVISL
ncbi:MAG: translation elongation factor Ts [Patescibacteria group bacterium]|jgi:elongation factor Ts